MAVIEFCRRSKGGRGPREKSDLRVYATAETGGERFSIGIRVNCAVMKRMRWLVGDLVRATFDDTNMKWTLRRVADETGNRLSAGGKKSGDATVRFAVDKSLLTSLCLSEGGSYDCELTDTEGDVAVFRML
jgi:hypothetical protein